MRLDSRTSRVVSAARALLLPGVLGAITAAGSPPAAGKVRITKQDDLPRHTYEISGPVLAMMESWEALAPLAKQVRADIESDLEEYDIQDETTLQDLYSTLLTLDLLEHRHESALARVGALREIEDKPALALTTGLGAEARVAAAREVEGVETGAAFRKAFRRHYAAKVSVLPWEVVQDVLQQNKAQMEMLSEGLLLGLARERLEPVVAEAPEVSSAIARQIIDFHAAIHLTLPVKDDVLAVLQEVVDRNREEKEDIWAARSLDLTGAEGLEPVIVAIWDTGVDVPVFGTQVFTNPAETVDGRDDDGNGFVDDVHGIAYDLHWRRTPALMYSMEEATRPVRELQGQMKGLFDMRAALDTPEAQALRRKMAGLGQDEVKSFLEDLGHYTMYSHGTHVAGIALEGNPAARVLVARLTGDPHVIPEAPTLEDCHRAAAAFHDIVDYYRAHGVRVVNMSWVIARSSIEDDLEANHVGENAQERKRMAREMFEVMKEGLKGAFESAPGILFVGGAGNSDNDVEFDEFFPPMFRLPNLLIAGAVDQAGEATSFTSFGPSVSVYANGFEVESYVPGGDRVKFSGTSMSSPNVVNLAAKLLALDPSLSPPQVIDLILDGATEAREGDRVMRVIHPARSADLLRRRTGKASM